MTTFQAFILAIIEGITEFLPVSSTGHMILASSFFGIEHDDFTKLFTIVIQLGAILSVIVLYFKRFFQTFEFYFKILVGFIPAVILGLLFSNKFSWLAFLLGVIFLHLVLLVPGLMGVFEVAALSGEQFGYIYGLAIMPLVVIQIFKLLFVRR